ncbi:MAG: MFS transporter [Dehalococcoidales bacterium]|nr:MFS transporter [Dehalococcoidales bacterium]
MPKETAYRYRWVILGVLWTAYLVVFLNRLSVGPLAPFFKAEWGITNAEVGMAMSAAALGYTLTMFPAGLLADKIGARLLIVGGCIIAGLCMIILFFAPSFTWLLILMFFTGFGCGVLMPSTTQGVVIWFPLRERATVMSFKQTAINIGGIITAATLPAVALSLGWRYGFLFLGIMALCIAGITLIFYKEPPQPITTADTSSQKQSTPPHALEILKNRGIWLVAAFSFFLSLVEFAVTSHLVLYLTESLFFPVVAAGGILAMNQAAGAFSRMAFGLLSDTIFKGKRKPVLIISGVLSCVTCVILSLWGPSLSWMLYPVIFILGAVSMGWGGVMLTLVSELAGRSAAGKAAGMVGTLGAGGVVLGPIVFGFIVDITRSYSLAWMVLAVSSVICVAAILFIKKEGNPAIITGGNIPTPAASNSLKS